MDPLSVLIVDDSSLIRQRLRLLFTRTDGLAVVGAARTCEEGLKLCAELNPDVVTVDISLPDGSGLDLIRDLTGMPSPPLVAVITNYPYPEFRARSLQAGARLFFSKNDPPARIAEGIAGLAMDAPEPSSGGTP